jgi:hypothetical protein
LLHKGKPGDPINPDYELMRVRKSIQDWGIEKIETLFWNNNLNQINNTNTIFESFSIYYLAPASPIRKYYNLLLDSFVINP